MQPQPRAAATTLPASLILTPREQKQYRRYQSQTTTLAPKRQGLLPTAVELADFQLWLTKRDSGYLSDTPLADVAYYAERAAKKDDDTGKASVCGHALHPTYTDKADRCPVCTVDAHLAYMRALTVALEDAGGLVKQRWEAADQECPALQAWYAGKLALLKNLGWLEGLAQLEQAHDQKHQQESQSHEPVGEFKTAGQALEMYWDSMEANTTGVKPSHKKSKKSAGTVDFCPDTSFEQGRDQLYFWRKSPRYEAGGKYSPSSSDNDEADFEEEDAQEQAVPANVAKSADISPSKEAVALVYDVDSEEECSDEDEDEDDDEDEDSDDEDLEDDEDATDADFVVFGYEEVEVELEVEVEGAEFVVFGD